MITKFSGSYRWLSNFAPCLIFIDGVTYPSVEHAYMSKKSNDESWKIYCSTTQSPIQVKEASKTIKLIDSWELQKVDIMLQCLRQKYNQEPYRTNLIKTGDLYIQEGNYWNDQFWGVDIRTGEGKNNLGKLIMFIREELKKDNL
jgi:hypothetical protein